MEIHSIQPCVPKSKIYGSQHKLTESENILMDYFESMQNSYSGDAHHSESFPGKSKNEKKMDIMQTNKQNITVFVNISKKLKKLNNTNLDKQIDHSKRPMTNPEFKNVISNIDDICVHDDTPNQHFYYLITKMNKSHSSLNHFSKRKSFWTKFKDLKSRMNMYASILYKYNVIMTHKLKYCKINPHTLFYSSETNEVLFNKPFLFQNESTECIKSKPNPKIKPNVLDMNLDLSPKIYRYEVMSLALLFIKLELKFLKSRKLKISTQYGDLLERINPKGSELKFKFTKNKMNVFEFINVVSEKIDYFDENVYMPWNIKYVLNDIKFLIENLIQIVENNSKKIFKNKKQFQNYKLFWETIRGLINNEKNYYKQPKIMEAYLRIQIIQERVSLLDMQNKHIEYSFLK